MPASLTNDILVSMNREVLNQLDLASSISHPGENGRAREKILAAYLRRVVPQGFGVDTGFVFDAVGGMSRQIDVVVYRTGYHPVFEIGGIKHFIVESVVAVFENKASIASVDSLTKAVANIESVKRLDRSNRNKNYIVGSSSGINPNDFRTQIFGAAVTESSLSRDYFRKEWTTLLKAMPRKLWPNFYADVRGFAAYYLKEGTPMFSTAIPGEGQWLGITEPTAPECVPSLLELTFHLLTYLRVAPIIDYKAADYLDLGEGCVEKFDL
jgi:hypothetical protein